MLLTSNPKTSAQALGYAIDIAIIENTMKRNNVDKNKLIDMLNSFTTCKKIVITYDYVPYEFNFRNEAETFKSLYTILGWVTGEGDLDEGMYVEKFIRNGFVCHDKDGYEVRMTFYND